MILDVKNCNEKKRCLSADQAGTSLGGKSDLTFSAKIGQPSGVWIGLIGRTTENELNGGMGTDETIIVSQSQR